LGVVVTARVGSDAVAAAVFLQFEKKRFTNSLPLMGDSKTSGATAWSSGKESGFWCRMALKNYISAEHHPKTTG
jgi:hypothetical protein